MNLCTLKKYFFNQSHKYLIFLGSTLKLLLTTTQAIIMLCKRIACEQSWPLELKIPNAQTRKTLEETDKNIGLIECKNIEDLFN